MLRVLRPGGYIFWWDGLRLANAAAAANAPLGPASLFKGLPLTCLRVGRQPTLGECIRVPPRTRPAVRALLDRLPVVNYPATHCAALIGPKG
jgi:hypothetical protein